MTDANKITRRAALGSAAGLFTLGAAEAKHTPAAVDKQVATVEDTGLLPGFSVETAAAAVISAVESDGYSIPAPIAIPFSCEPPNFYVRPTDTGQVHFIPAISALRHALEHRTTKDPATMHTLHRVSEQVFYHYCPRDRFGDQPDVMSSPAKLHGLTRIATSKFLTDFADMDDMTLARLIYSPAKVLAVQAIEALRRTRRGMTYPRFYVNRTPFGVEILAWAYSADGTVTVRHR